MLRLKTAGRVAVLAAALPLSGCAAMFGGYDLAPNGLPRAEDALRSQLAFAPDRAYSMCIDGKTDLPDDDLLRLLPVRARRTRVVTRFREVDIVDPQPRSGPHRAGERNKIAMVRKTIITALLGASALTLLAGGSIFSRISP